MQREIHGVFVRDGADNPVAIFSDPRAARDYLVANHGDDNAVVVPLEATVSAASLRSAEDVVAGRFPAPAAPAEVLDPERERIRATVLQERRDAQLRTEVEAELDAAEKPQKSDAKGKAD